MSKIRKKFLEQIDVNSAIEFDNIMKNAFFIEQFSENLYFSQINYLTYDELVYLYNKNDNSQESKKILLDLIKDAEIILNKYKECLKNGTYDRLIRIEEDRILILLGLKTVNEVFPNFFSKEEMGFNLSDEEISQKNRLINDIVIKKIDADENKVFLKIQKYAYIYYSITLFFRYIKDGELDAKQIDNEEKLIFSNLNSLINTMSFYQCDVNSLHVKYINEKNKMLKFIYYHLILDSSNEQKIVNELYLNKKLNRLNEDSLSYYYLTGGGNPFMLNGIEKIDTISTKALDAILIMLEEKHNINDKQNNETENSKIIKFPKKI